MGYKKSQYLINNYGQISNDVNIYTNSVVHLNRKTFICKIKDQSHGNHQYKNLDTRNDNSAEYNYLLNCSIEAIAAEERIPFVVLLSIVCSGMKLSSISGVSNAFPRFGVRS